MNWVSEHRHWLLFAAFVLTAVSAVGVAAVGVVATLSTLLTGGSLVATVGTFLLGALLLVGLNVVFGAALFSTLASRASVPTVSLPTSQRAADACHRVESAVPPLARVGLGDRFEPSVEQQRADLTDRYVEGELSEAELEAELGTLLDDETTETASTDTEFSSERGAEPELET